MASIAQAREIIGKNSDNYKRFETYDTRRPAKKAWGEVLEQFLRSRGPSACRSRARCRRVPLPHAPPVQRLWRSFQLTPPSAGCAPPGFTPAPGRGTAALSPATLSWRFPCPRGARLANFGYFGCCCCQHPASHPVPGLRYALTRRWNYLEPGRSGQGA
jgi:hypothetical protein